MTQLSLPGLDADPSLFRPANIAKRRGQLRGYTLLLAIFPKPEDTRRIGPTAGRLCEQHGVLGRCLAKDRLHITLHTLAHFKETLPQAVIGAAKAAASSVACAPLDLVFDHALSFQHSNAFVMRCDGNSDMAIAKLRHSLKRALERFGLDPTPSQTPHMTLAYDAPQTPQHPIAPVRWTATRFALIVSHVGLTHHELLSEWRLTDSR